MKSNNLRVICAFTLCTALLSVFALGYWVERLHADIDIPLSRPVAVTVTGLTPLAAEQPEEDTAPPEDVTATPEDITSPLEDTEPASVPEAETESDELETEADEQNDSLPQPETEAGEQPEDSADNG